MRREDLGWNDFFETAFAPFRAEGMSPLRVLRENRGTYLALGASGIADDHNQDNTNIMASEFACEISGKLRFETRTRAAFPAVGDWVAASIRPEEDAATIHAVLPRKSAFSRKVAGQLTDEQVVAANIDIVFIVTGLDGNFNLRRIERYLSMAWESGAMPVVLLNKADLCPDPEEQKTAVEMIAPGVDVYLLCASEKSGLDIFQQYLKPGRTAAFLGSSGVGKSTIINSLLGSDRLETAEVSGFESRGRHTTTFRELILLPTGGMVVDTPGMRELQVWGDEDGVKQTFDDIETLATRCRFRDCSHEKEPGCAVQDAVSNGSLEAKRLGSYLKLRREFAYLAARQKMSANAVEKSKWKTITKRIKGMKNNHEIQGF